LLLRRHSGERSYSGTALKEKRDGDAKKRPNGILPGFVRRKDEGGREAKEEIIT